MTILIFPFRSSQDTKKQENPDYFIRKPLARGEKGGVTNVSIVLSPEKTYIVNFSQIT